MRGQRNLIRWFIYVLLADGNDNQNNNNKRANWRTWTWHFYNPAWENTCFDRVSHCLRNPGCYFINGAWVIQGVGVAAPRVLGSWSHVSGLLTGLGAQWRILRHGTGIPGSPRSAACLAGSDTGQCQIFWHWTMPNAYHFSAKCPNLAKEAKRRGHYSLFLRPSRRKRSSPQSY